MKPDKQGRYQLNESTTYFFKLGPVNVYSDTNYVFACIQNDQAVWFPIDDPTQFEIRPVNFTSAAFRAAKSQFKSDIDEIGTFMIIGHKWGFLLFLDTLEPVYKGTLNNTWLRVMRVDFFFDLVRTHAYYNFDDSDQPQYIKQLLSTADDDPVLPDLVPFYDQLFPHQRREVGWMFAREKAPWVRIPQQLGALPFFDTGFFVDPNRTGEIFEEKDIRMENINMPGGILASSIGSGKTVSMIALMSVGANMIRMKKAVELERAKHPNKEIDLKQIKINGSHFQDYEEEEKVVAGGKKALNDKISKGEDERDERTIKLLTDITGKAKPSPLSIVEPYFNLRNIEAPSLVIVTKNILHQWYDEFKRFDPSLRVLLVEDISSLEKIETKRETSATIGYLLTIKNYDVVLTYREAIAEMVRRPDEGQSKVLEKVQWRRIIIDEFHELTRELKKFPKKTLKFNTHLEGFPAVVRDVAIFILEAVADFCWGITGTPDQLNFHEGVDHIFRLLRFSREDLRQSSDQALSHAFFMNCIRKNMRSVDLPPIESMACPVEFTQMMHLFYKSKYNYALDEAAAREMCSHILPEWELDEEFEQDKYQLAIQKVMERQTEEINRVKAELEQDPHNKKLESRHKSLLSEDHYYKSVINAISLNSFSCPICLLTDITREEIVLTECFHVICAKCWQALFKSLVEAKCPLCKASVQEKAVIIHPKFRLIKNSKMRTLLYEIERVPEGEKIIVFTQFTNLLLRLCRLFSGIGLEYIVLSGVPSDLNFRLMQFKKSETIKVLLMSIEQSASGINVPEANHVFFVHPIFGMNADQACITYKQCVGRVHRVGQKKKVYAKLFYTQSSLEEELISSFSKALLGSQL